MTAVTVTKKEIQISLRKYAGIGDAPVDGILYCRVNGQWVEAPGATGGEANTLASQGGAISLVGTKIGSVLGIKSIEAGENVSIEVEGDKLIVSSTGGSGDPLDYTFDNTNLVNNVLTVPHGFNRFPACITIYDPNGNEATAMTSATTTHIIIDFGGTVTGTWRVVAL